MSSYLDCKLEEQSVQTERAESSERSLVQSGKQEPMNLTANHDQCTQSGPWKPLITMIKQEPNEWTSEHCESDALCIEPSSNMWNDKDMRPPTLEIKTEVCGWDEQPRDISSRENITEREHIPLDKGERLPKIELYHGHDTLINTDVKAEEGTVYQGNYSDNFDNAERNRKLTVTLINTLSDQDDKYCERNIPDQHMLSKQKKNSKDMKTEQNGSEGSVDVSPLCHECSNCGKVFDTLLQFKRHMRSHHKEKRHKCKECKRAFLLPCQLKSHMRSHTGERPHQCSICGKCFTLPGNLRRHIVTHTGLSDHTCEECGKAFGCTTLLRRHAFTHTGDRPYSCPECSRGFSRAFALSQHMVLHTGEGPKCQICDRAFASARNLKNHLKHHNKTCRLQKQNVKSSIVSQI